MKAKRILALVLAALTATALIACSNGGDSETTTTAATTTAAPLPTPNPNETTDNNETGDLPGDATGDATTPAGETPITDADEIATLIAGGNLTSTVVAEEIALNGLTAFSDNEGVAKLFDGDTAATKLCGNAMAETGAEITWKTSTATIVNAYVLYTGNDSATWKRTPQAWTLSGSNDGENWTVIDEVAVSNMTDVDATPFGYTVDAPAAYTNYKLVITSTTTAGELQFNEIVLVGAEAPVTGDDAITALIGENNLTSTVTDIALAGLTAFSDNEGVAKLFDGDTAATKLCGNAMAETGAEITWKTSTATTVNAYVLYTGNDSATWKRTPQAWTLSGSNDGENWTVIDEVAASGMADVDATPYGYTVDAPAAYTNYKLVITSTTQAGELQFNEIILVGTAAE